MTKFLSTTKGKIIAGAATLAIIAVVIVIIVIANQGYRSIVVDKLNGVTTVTAGGAESEAFEGQNLKSGDNVAVSESSDLTLALDTDKHVFARENTRFRLEAFGAAGKDSKTVIYLEEGSVLSEIDEPLGAAESYVVDTPNASMAVRGTVFTVETDGEMTSVSVDKGEVEATDKETGETTIITAGESASFGFSEPVYNDPEALAVEAAIEAYLDGGALDTTNFNRVTGLGIVGKIAFVELDCKLNGRGENTGVMFNGYDDTLEKIGDMAVFVNAGEETVEIPTEPNRISSLDFISEMKNIRTILYHYGTLSDISALAKSDKLLSVNFQKTNISDVSPLSGLVNLRSINILESNVSDISPLKGLTQLQELNLFGNNITDISAIENMSELYVFSIGGNKIDDISYIKDKTKLIGLSMINVEISDISWLSQMPELTSLELRENNISDISVLSGLKN